MSLTILLYKSILKTTQAYSKASLPLTGIVGTRWTAPPTLDVVGYVRHLFRQPTDTLQADLNEGLHAFRQLNKQLSVLQQADETYRSALSMWAREQAEVVERMRAMPQHGEAQAVLHAWGLLEVLTNDFPNSSAASRDEQLIQHQTELRSSLSDLADEVRRSAPAHLMHQDQLGGTAGVGPEHLRFLSEELFQKRKFRNYPFEWVYDGLDPARLRCVLKTTKGMPLTLGALYTQVGTMLGVDLRMCATPVPSVHIPEELMNMKGRQVRVGGSTGQGPPPLQWTVQTEGTEDGKPVLISVDVSRKGEVTTHPRASVSEPQSPYARRGFHMDVWAEMARVMVTAHQRRGQSDEVAFWMYQSMALDANAEEWAQFRTYIE
eukprot:CAMPEP_0206139132 /NCGR_PEP_ID=MMETSP1473-20131121/4861_1 /ASSEMBLY_ACC=CAM_ASM_001109 /TAXON_ID=1461547 /ORGANISM="Stichococcus sp, Strain RCC1054" /LENGTH=376 /DNA_ID=CAMNT_0053532783 /DNA_START=301 /DNA_END=1431 /DNA_ORIENTATION=+